MSESGAQEECAFCRVKVDKVRGIYGVETFLDRIITKMDVSKLIKNHHDLHRDHVQEIIKARNSGIASLFRKPENSNPLFNYPYWYTGDKGCFSDPDLRIKFFKSIRSIPSKARHKNYHLQVLGRLGLPWALVALLLLRLTLVREIIRSHPCCGNRCCTCITQVP